MINLKLGDSKIFPKSIASIDWSAELPEEVVTAFEKLGKQQRGRPESAMLDIQKFSGGGVLEHCVEHVGDLSHRMTEVVKAHGWARESVHGKLKSCLRILESPYGFEKEMEDNIRNNTKWKNKRKPNSITEEQYKKKLKELSLKYAKEHEKLKVHNLMQEYARDAAIYLGEWRFDMAIHMLKKIQANTKTTDKFVEETTKYKLLSSKRVWSY